MIKFKDEYVFEDVAYIFFSTSYYNIGFLPSPSNRGAPIRFEVSGVTNSWTLVIKHRIETSVDLQSIGEDSFSFVTLNKTKIGVKFRIFMGKLTSRAGDNGGGGEMKSILQYSCFNNKRVVHFLKKLYLRIRKRDIWKPFCNTIFNFKIRVFLNNA